MASRHHPFAIAKIGKQSRIQIQSDGLARPVFEFNALKADEPAQSLTIPLDQIDLGNIITITFPGVGNRETDPQRVALHNAR